MGPSGPQENPAGCQLEVSRPQAKGAPSRHEALHRYTAIDRREAIQPCLDVLYGITDEVFPVEEKDALTAKDLVLGYPQISARDALHVAIMQAHHISRIFSFDQGYDRISWLNRIS
jgi:uncharacterized protein